VSDTNKVFKRLLALLNQNYFPGIFDGEHYVANSKPPVSLCEQDPASKIDPQPSYVASDITAVLE
jgi:hypothetical protein